MSRDFCETFAGSGGSLAGYIASGLFDTYTAVDSDPARLAELAERFPDVECIEADAVEFLAKYGRDFTHHHAGPTCTGYSQGTAALPDRLERYHRLIPVVRELLRDTGRPYVIENVRGALPEMRNPLMLCWTMFNEPGSVKDDDGTRLWMKRHRFFESNVWLLPAGECWHPETMQCAGAYGGARRDKHEARNIRHGGYVPSVPVMAELLGIDWMSERGLQLCVPPAYTEWLAWQIVEGEIL